MTTLKERYLAKRKAGVIIQDAPPVVEVKQSVWDTIFDGVRCDDRDDDIYYDAIEAVHIVQDLLEDIGVSADRRYSVAEIVRLQTAIEWALGGER